jgi:putative transposase
MVESNRPMPPHSVMPQSLAKTLMHTVFSTKDRRPFLRDKPVREELHRYLGGILTNLAGQRVIVGGAEDHVHLYGIDSTLSALMEIVGPCPRVARASRPLG